MTWFVLLFLTTYSLMHLYVFLRLIKPNLSRGKSFFILLIFSLMVMSPILGRILDKRGDTELAYIITLTALLWMGFVVYVVVLTLLLDIYKGLVFLSKKFLGINPLPTPSGRLSLVLITLLGFTLSAYSYYETLRLEVIRIEIESPKINRRIKILHVSDLHLGPVMGRDKIELIREVWEKEKPDIIVSTGDLVDGNMKGKEHLADMLKRLNAPMGKFAVLGNHEYYRDVYQAIDFTRRAGFELLRGEKRELGEIVIVGVDDDDCKFFNLCQGSTDEEEILKALPRDKFVILLKHKPKINPNSVGKFDLMLSGHTHGGVYEPVGRFILRRLFIIDRGFVKLGDSYVFVSKGVGTGGPPMRLLSPPDVAIVELSPKKP